MTLLEFRRLRELKQMKIVRQRGVKLAERMDRKNRYVLYQLDGFYVEFAYDLYSSSLKEMDVFGGTVLLDPYLEAIRIPFSF